MILSLAVPELPCTQSAAKGLARERGSRRIPLVGSWHFSSVYAALRAKGQRHGQALRSISDRLLRILMAMLRDRTCYDVSRIRRELVVQMG